MMITSDSINEWNLTDRSNHTVHERNLGRYRVAGNVKPKIFLTRIFFKVH